MIMMMMTMVCVFFSLLCFLSWRDNQLLFLIDLFLEWLGLALNLSLLVMKGLLFGGFFGVSGTVRGNRRKDYMRMYRER